MHVFQWGDTLQNDEKTRLKQFIQTRVKHFFRYFGQQFTIFTFTEINNDTHTKNKLDFSSFETNGN